MFTELQYSLLKRIAPYSKDSPNNGQETRWVGEAKIKLLLGNHFLNGLQGKKVIDFGCGEGHEAIAIARLTDCTVTGLDIRESVLETGRSSAREAGVSDRCSFTTSYEGKADAVICIDAFEHFENPGAILSTLSDLLKPDGKVFFSFGPTWYHPLGGHLFSVFPWSHLLFSEQALIRWRSDFKSDGARRFGEVEGGLNQMTIKRFRQLVAESPLSLEAIDCVPIGRLRPLHNPLTQEFFTAIVRGVLRKR